MSFKLNRYQHRGFTLLEMVLVLFLIGLMASATLLLTEGVEDQAKYDETKHRMEIIRKAIIGDPTRTINGRPEISGFASDIGRLPLCIAELLTLGDEILPATVPQRFSSPCDVNEEISIWHEYSDAQMWSGWRGPYIQVITERNDVFYRDGYGNADLNNIIDLENSGWNYSVNSGEVSLISNGYDGLLASADDIGDTGLIVQSDYQVALGGDWRKLEVKFFDASPSSSLPQDNLRVRLNSPQNGRIVAFGEDGLSTSDERDSSPYLSRVFTVLSPDSDDEISMSAQWEISLSPDATWPVDHEITVTSETVFTIKDTNTVPASNVGAFRIDTCGSSCTVTIPTTSITFEHENTSVLASGAGVAIDSILFQAADVIQLEDSHSVLNVIDSLIKRTITVPAGSTFLGNITLPFLAQISLPAGSSIDGTTVFLAGENITVSEAFVLSGTSVATVNSGDAFSVPRGTVRGVAANTLIIPANLTVNTGVKTLTIVCEIDGEIYDGDCTDGIQNGAKAQGIVLSPRNTLPLNNQELEWVIQ